MKRYAAEVTIKIRRRVIVEDKSVADAMCYAEHRDSKELLRAMENRTDEVYVDYVDELKD